MLSPTKDTEARGQPLSLRSLTPSNDSQKVPLMSLCPVQAGILDGQNRHSAAPTILQFHVEQEKASAEIRGEFFRPTGEFCRGFFGGFFRAFFLGKIHQESTPKSTQKSTTIFKSAFGSFGSKIHTARILP